MRIGQRAFNPYFETHGYKSQEADRSVASEAAEAAAAIGRRAQQPDDPGEPKRLEAEIAAAEAELHKLKAS